MYLICLNRRWGSRPKVRHFCWTSVSGHGCTPNGDGFQPTKSAFAGTSKNSRFIQLPVFFVNHDGGVGFLLTDILQGRDSNLYNRDSQPPLGGRITTRIRIDVSPQTFMLADGTFVNILRIHGDPVIAVGNARFLQKTRDLCTESDHAWPFHEARWQFGQQILRCELLSSSPVMSLIEFLLF